MPQKLYCYVDESGQDTRGRLFVVGVVVAGAERDSIRQMCEEVEHVSGKGNWKWVRAPYQRQLAYARRIVQEPLIQGKLYFAIIDGPRDYLSHTIECIVRALEGYAVADYRVTVLIDGLPAALERIVGQNMRRRGIRVRKVRGVRDEGDALIRLADAVCGLVRAAEASPEMSQLVEWGKQAGVLRDVSP